MYHIFIPFLLCGAVGSQTLTSLIPLTSLIHRIYNIKYHEVIHKKYQIYRVRNYLDMRVNQSALTITLSVYVNELLCPVPLFCLSLCHTIVSSMCSLVSVVWVAWHTCLPSVWLGLTYPSRHQPGYYLYSTLLLGSLLSVPYPTTGFTWVL